MFIKCIKYFIAIKKSNITNNNVSSGAGNDMNDDKQR